MISRRRLLLQVFGDGSSLGEFTSSGTTLGFENWTLNAKDVSTITLMPKYLGNDWISITEVREHPNLGADPLIASKLAFNTYLWVGGRFTCARRVR